MKKIFTYLVVLTTVLTSFDALALIQGKNYAKMSIDSNGNVGNVELVRQIDRDLDEQALDLCKCLTNIDSIYWGKDILVPITYDGLCESGNTTLTRDHILLDEATIIGDRLIYYDDSGEIFLAGNCSMPTFPGGEPALFEYIKENLDYPDNVDWDTIQGTVVAKFYVNEIGKVTDVIIKKSLHYYIDREVVNLCLSFPDFIPAKDIKGNPKGEWMTLPISFRKSDYDDFKIRELSNEEVEIYSVASQPPAFPGGDEQLFKFIFQNLQYPSICGDAQIQGKVILRFVVKANGEIGKVEVIRSVDSVLDREAIRVVKMLPSFVPARNAKGENVDCWYILPINFKVLPYPVEPPTFPGGETALLKFILQNLKYPAIDEQEQMQGKILLKFVVKNTGEIGDVEVLNPLNTKLEKEVVRVIKLLPKFIPAHDGEGKAINYWYTLPLNINPNNK